MRTFLGKRFWKIVRFFRLLNNLIILKWSLLFFSLFDYFCLIPFRRNRRIYLLFYLIVSIYRGIIYRNTLRLLNPHVNRHLSSHNILRMVIWSWGISLVWRLQMQIHCVNWRTFILSIVCFNLWRIITFLKNSLFILPILRSFRCSLTSIFLISGWFRCF